MNELTLTNEQASGRHRRPGASGVYLWQHLGTYQLDIEPKTEPEGKDTSKLKNANYGAYIQLAGRYYN